MELAPSARVTAGFFEALGVQPLLGRTFRVADENPGGYRVAILSHHAWRLRFGGDPDIIGRSVTVGGEPAEVVGVLPEGFRYPFAVTCDSSSQSASPPTSAVTAAFIPMTPSAD